MPPHERLNNRDTAIIDPHEQRTDEGQPVLILAETPDKHVLRHNGDEEIMLSPSQAAWLGALSTSKSGVTLIECLERADRAADRDVKTVLEFRNAWLGLGEILPGFARPITFPDKVGSKKIEKYTIEGAVIKIADEEADDGLGESQEPEDKTEEEITIIHKPARIKSKAPSAVSQLDRSECTVTVLEPASAESQKVFIQDPQIKAAGMMRRRVERGQKLAAELLDDDTPLEESLLAKFVLGDMQQVFISQLPDSTINNVIDLIEQSDIKLSNTMQKRLIHLNQVLVRRAESNRSVRELDSGQSWLMSTAHEQHPSGDTSANHHPAPEDDWREEAKCLQAEPDTFFPDKGGSTREAKRICSMCDVKTECLEYALANEERFGIWGGMSERERRNLQRRALDTRPKPKKKQVKKSRPRKPKAFELCEMAEVQETRSIGAPEILTQFDEETIEPTNVYVAVGQQTFKIPPKELYILAYFASHPGQEIARGSIMNTSGFASTFEDTENMEHIMLTGFFSRTIKNIEKLFQSENMTTPIKHNGGHGKNSAYTFAQPEETFKFFVTSSHSNEALSKAS